jgi:hypothetical protein
MGARWSRSSAPPWIAGVAYGRSWAEQIPDRQLRHCRRRRRRPSARHSSRPRW